MLGFPSVAPGCQRLTPLRGLRLPVACLGRVRVPDGLPWRGSPAYAACGALAGCFCYSGDGLPREAFQPRPPAPYGAPCSSQGALTLLPLQGTEGVLCLGFYLTSRPGARKPAPALDFLRFRPSRSSPPSTIGFLPRQLSPKPCSPPFNYLVSPSVRRVFTPFNYLARG